MKNFSKVFWDSENWTKKISKNENLKILSDNFDASLNN